MFYSGFSEISTSSLIRCKDLIISINFKISNLALWLNQIIGPNKNRINSSSWNSQRTRALLRVTRAIKPLEHEMYIATTFIFHLLICSLLVILYSRTNPGYKTSRTPHHSWQQPFRSAGAIPRHPGVLVHLSSRLGAHRAQKNPAEHTAECLSLPPVLQLVHECAQWQ